MPVTTRAFLLALRQLDWKYNRLASEIKESEMKRTSFLLSLAGTILVLVVGMSAGNLNTKGKDWLAAHSEAAAININGDWRAKEWGEIVLKQAEGSRDVTGYGDGWDITGVVSGKQVFLLFSHRGGVAYSAILTSVDDKNLNGSYSRGFMDEKTKSKPMLMEKIR